MRTIKYTTQFKRDYKREKRRYGVTLDKDLLKVVKLLVTNIQLPKSMYDHLLTGNWKDHRDCHIKPDLVLIYRKPNTTYWSLFVLVHTVSLVYSLYVPVFKILLQKQEKENLARF